MERQALTRNQILEQLTRSPHGKLEAYTEVGQLARTHDPEFFSRMIAWNADKGSIRDSKVALPVIGATFHPMPEQHHFGQNALACMALLDPRNFVRALDFARTLKYGAQPAINQRALRRLVEQYIRHREQAYPVWERAYIQHRESMNTLYKRYHIKPGAPAIENALKRKYIKGSTLDIISQLKNMAPQEALGHVLNRNIPFLVAIGALGSKVHDTDVVLALINSMSATELTTNAKMLEKLGVKSNPALRAAFASGLQKAVEAAPQQALLKATKAAQAVGGDMGKQLAQTQERQIKATGGVKGRWLVIGDCSGSMERTIEIARNVASHIARFAESCHLVYCNNAPTLYREVTGMTLEQIQELTQYVRGTGGTAMAAGMRYILERKIEVDGIAVITDCEDGAPAMFVSAYNKYCTEHGREPTLYVFRVPGGSSNTLTPMLQRENVLTEEFDLRKGFDYYSLPNIIALLNTRKWGLLDQIMEYPLKTLKEVFSTKP